jgi:hypothetical protein
MAAFNICICPLDRLGPISCNAATSSPLASEMSFSSECATRDVYQQEPISIPAEPQLCRGDDADGVVAVGATVHQDFRQLVA